MAPKFLNIDEAAEKLGITKEKLNQLREEGQAHAYRDGGSWKFKEEEIDRLSSQLTADEGEIELDVEGDAETGADSILLSELELGDSPKGPSSTVIGKSEAGDLEGIKDDSDLKLSDDSDLKLGSDDELELDGSAPGVGSSDVLGGGQDATSAADTGLGSGSSSTFEELEDVDLDLESESIKLASDIDLSEGSDKPSGVDDRAGDSAVELAADEDDELVLGEGSGSDVTLSSGDSGISLGSPADSGLSLDEEPLELAGSTVESLELGEDEEILLEGEADSEAATQLKADDDFLLTPLEEAGGEETEDSGSQVIALDSESFDESADTMLGAGLGQGAAVLADELGGGSQVGPIGTGATALLGPAPASVPELPYSIANVLFLSLCLVALSLTGIMMYDLIRNMWSWNDAYALNSSLMDELTQMIPIFK